MNKEKIRKLIPDFARKIAPIYKMLEWTWWSKELHDYDIPSASEIAETLNMLLDNLGENQSVSGGGLCVSHDKAENMLSMEFTVLECVHFDE